METIINEYELTFIMRPDLSEDVHTRTIEKFNEVIEGFGGSMFVSDSWGRLKLAYPIRKHNHGFYIYLNYVGPAELPHELERIIRLDDTIIRFLTVKLDDEVMDVDGIQEGSKSRHQAWVDRRSTVEPSMRR
jgi:small subunit ribosomal protein S6